MVSKIKTILFVALVFIGISVNGQTSGVIVGTVADAETQEPLIGVNVILADTQRGGVTDETGRFEIRNLQAGLYRLVFSYIGYETLMLTDIAVNSARPVDVKAQMKSQAIEGQEVVVTAGYFLEDTQAKTSTVALSREEIRRFPGGYEDVVRTISTLPGVAINNAQGRNDLLVRGGGPSENLYVVNNIEVPNINHFGSQGSSSGSLSFINLDFVDNVTFSTGGFGAQYGDKMSSTLTLDLAPGRRDRLGTKGLVSATQYGLNLEGPIADNGSFIFSARRSYLDLIFKAAGVPFVPVYTDYNLVAQYDISPREKLLVLGFAALDNVDRDLTTPKNRLFNAAVMDNTQRQWIGGVNYRRLITNGYLDVTFNTNLNQYRFAQANQDLVRYFQSDANEREIAFKLQPFIKLNRQIGLLSGVSVKAITNQNTTTFADTIYNRSGNAIPRSALGLPAVNTTDRTGVKGAAFSELRWTLTERFQVNAGLRMDYYSFLDQPTYIAPRLTMEYALSNRLTTNFSIGEYYQSPSNVWLNNPANSQLKALRNTMTIAGWDYLLRDDLKLSMEGYHKVYRDLATGTIPGVNDYLVITNAGTGYGGSEDDFQSFGYTQQVSIGTGRAYGAEILLQKKFSIIPSYYQVSLSYGKSEYTAGNGKTYPGQWDQRWILNLSGGYKFNRNWELSAKYRFYTGVPYTPVYKPEENPINPGEISNLPTEYLSARLDAGQQTDIRLDRYFYLSKWTAILYIDIQNVFDSRSQVRPSYDFRTGTVTDRTSIGILPSIGINMEF
ncbi:MAG: TonB-dependent receptor [Candidatus Marinimicrobia bacterium]|nr:TonB-dependent receptor [Candidatus Neomarinimicrobiota bacterium]